jgi:hypothetical protein
MSIPASTLVNVIPQVLGAGGSALQFNGVILTENATLPVGAPMPFASYQAVATYFGATSLEAQMAQVYFTGYTKATQLPVQLFFTRYAESAVAAFMNGGPAPTLSVAKLATAGKLTFTIDGTVAALTAIDLSGQASLAAVASTIQSALQAALQAASYAAYASVTVAYNTQLKIFVVTSGTTGASSTMTYATITGSGANDLATVLGFTAASGATLSQGANVDSPATFMNALVGYTQNWVAFTTTFLPSAGDLEAFATWTDGTDGRYLYAPWDNNATAAENPETFAGFGKWLATNQPSGTSPVWAGASPDVTDGPLLAAFVLGTTAAINFNVQDGRITYAFKANTLLTPMVTDETTAANLKANGYNFYGEYATANQEFLYFNPGQVSGSNLWIDEYVDAIWLNNALQLALVTLFGNTNSLPYDNDGYNMISAAVQGPIQQALLNGVTRTGVALSAAQIAEANSQAGLDISVQLQNQGYYFQVVPVTDPTVRAARTSPVCNLWYTDGGSIQQITLNSVDIQ